MINSIYLSSIIPLINWRTNMKSIKSISIFLLSFLIFTLQVIPVKEAFASTNDKITPFKILLPNTVTMKIGEERYALDGPNTNSLCKFKSSKPSVVSIDEFGKAVAKKAGSAVISISWLLSSIKVQVTVLPTDVILNSTKVTLESSQMFQLKAHVSDNSSVTYKSKNRKIASVDEFGNITAIAPGETIITVSANKVKKPCKVIVKAPVIHMNKTSISLYRNQTATLSVTTSNGATPTWKSSKKSVVTVSKDGLLTAKKHGTATITATVNGVSTTCSVTVLQPKIYVPNTSCKLSVGDSKLLYVKVSSGNKPKFTSSNKKVVTVSRDGQLTAKKAGTAYITISEDGIKIKYRVTVA